MSNITNISSKIMEVYSLEQLSQKETFIHNINTLCKMIITIFFVITVVSFSPYTVSALVPFFFYPIVIMVLAEIPFSIVVKRTLIAMPFCLFAGLSNLFFNRAIAFSVYGINITYGLLSFVSIMIRTPLCVSAILILVATTPIMSLTNTMRKIKIPNVFVSLFEMIYRYFTVLLGEANSMTIAYQLRNNGKKGVDIANIGSLIGQLLIRSTDRAERIYSAMKCRGYGRVVQNDCSFKLNVSDILFLITVCFFCVLFRIVNVPVFLGGFFQ